MLKTFRNIDYSEMFAPGTKRAMVVLTYPRDWPSLVPNGKVAARHREEFFRRLERAFASPARLLWVREFANSGAPHFHIFLQIPEGVVGHRHREQFEQRMAEWKAGRRSTKPRWRPPAHEGLTFAQWVKKVWPEIVNHPDPTQRAKHEEYGSSISIWHTEGIKELIAYFSKPTGTGKSYQHKVPELWKTSDESIQGNYGKRGLKTAEVAVQISFREFIYLSRIFRRRKRQVRSWNSETEQYELKPALKKVRRPRGPVLGYKKDENGVLQPIQKPRWTNSRRRTTSHTGAGAILPDNGPEIARSLYNHLVARTAPQVSTARLPAGLRGSLQDRLIRRATEPASTP